jgi:hypothetical protein
VLALSALLAVLGACSGETASIAPTTTTAGPSTTTTSVGAPTTTAAPLTTTTWPEDPGLLLVVGDWGSGTAPQGAVAGAMRRVSESAEVDAILTTGDNLYSNNVSFIMEPYQWALDSGIPFWITWGNHDIASEERVGLVNEVFASPPRWTTHTWGAVEIVILDSNQVDDPEQLAFVEEVLSEVTSPTIVVFHHPPFSCGKYVDDGTVLGQWAPLFDDEVVLVLSGHDHNYQRFLVEDLSYVVTGGGGRGLYAVDDCLSGHPPLEHGEVKHHFMILEQTAGRLTVSAIDILGEVLDTTEIALR